MSVKLTKHRYIFFSFQVRTIYEELCNCIFKLTIENVVYIGY